ncbi:PqqD family protein [Chloroflexota bacterium]
MTDIKSRVIISDQVMFRDLGDEMVLLNIETGKYFGLDDVGARLWALLEEHGSLDLAFQTLLGEYEVSEHQLQADLIRLVDELAAQQLLVVA